MRFHPIRTSLLVVSALLLSALPARAGVSFDPFSDLWEFDARPASGKIVSIVEKTYQPMFDGTPEPKMPEKPQGNSKIAFENGKMASRSSISPDGTQESLFATIKYDAAGRKQVVTEAVGGPSQSTETAAYDAAGNLTSITVEAKEGRRAGKNAIAIKAEATADGGKKMSWIIGEEAGKKLEGTAVFDKAGRLTKLEATYGGKVFVSSPTFVYNEHGDLARLETSSNSAEIYEREYDAQGNWTKLTVTTVIKQGDKEHKGVQRKVEREITYAK